MWSMVGFVNVVTCFSPIQTPCNAQRLNFRPSHSISAFGLIHWKILSDYKVKSNIFIEHTHSQCKIPIYVCRHRNIDLAWTEPTQEFVFINGLANWIPFWELSHAPWEPNIRKTVCLPNYSTCVPLLLASRTTLKWLHYRKR